jgi:hypothetical protein
MYVNEELSKGEHYGGETHSREGGGASFWWVWSFVLERETLEMEVLFV